MRVILGVGSKSSPKTNREPARIDSARYRCLHWVSQTMASRRSSPVAEKLEDSDLSTDWFTDIDRSG